MKQKEKPIFHQKVLMEKYPEKGGWTYATLKDIIFPKDRKSKQLTVKGTIDGYEIDQYNLFSIKDGRKFLPFKKEIRKAIHKEAGDFVEVILYLDDSPINIPDEIQLCLNDDELIKSKFELLTVGKKKYYIDWIMKGKHAETRANRIVKMMTEIDQIRH